MNFLNRFQPAQLIIIMLLVGSVFIGWSITATLQHAKDVKGILEQNKRILEQGIKDQELQFNASYSADLRDSEQNENIEKILDQQGNLSKESRDKIIQSLIKNEQEVIPKILNMTTEANEFWSFLRSNFDETYLENEYRQYNQSNQSAQLLSEINEKLDILLNGSLKSP